MTDKVLKFFLVKNPLKLEKVILILPSSDEICHPLCKMRIKFCQQMLNQRRMKKNSFVPFLIWFNKPHSLIVSIVNVATPFFH